MSNKGGITSIENKSTNTKDTGGASSVTSSSITTNTEGKSETKPTDVTPSVTHYCTIHFNALEIITPFLNSFTSSRETIGGTDSWRKMDAKCCPIYSPN